MKTKVSTTLACADLMNVSKDVGILDSLGMDAYHIDIMDGCYVPNYCLSWDFVRQLSKITRTPIDVHLMTTNIDRDIDTALTLDIDALAFHAESSDEKSLERIARIKGRGIKAGIALSPDSEVSKVTDLLDKVDYVLVMGVKPGFSGQRFIEGTYDKISALSAQRSKRGLSFDIFVDGGIDGQNGRICVQRGADILVAGALCIYSERGRLRELTLKFFDDIGREA